MKSVASRKKQYEKPFSQPGSRAYDVLLMSISAADFAAATAS